jgi:UDP-GlcNAc3NAcA epimerase
MHNLAAEGMKGSVYLVGDVMQDALAEHLVVAENRSEILKQLDLNPNEYFVTVHRAENTESLQRLNGICEALRTLSSTNCVAGSSTYAQAPQTRGRWQDRSVY